MRKTVPIRVLHAITFEVGLLFVLMPFIAWYLGVSLMEAFLIDVSFAAFYLTVGAGRPNDTLNAAGQHIFGALQMFFQDLLAQPHFALSLDIRVSDPDLSWNDTPINGRLTQKD